MDNNENNINNENLVEENTTTSEVNETVDNNGTDENGAYVSQFGELTNADGEPLETTVPVEEPKKKFFLFKYIHPSIFIAICVFLVALIAFGVYQVFGSKTITGTWMREVENNSSASSTADEVEKIAVYYTFEKADSDGKGTYYMNVQGEQSKGEYTLSTSGDKKKITIGNSELTYEVTGIKLFGSAKLKLTQDAYTDQTTGQKVDSQTIEMNQDKDPGYDEMSMKDYKVDKDLVSKWKTDFKISYYYGMYQLDCDIEIKDNGIMTVHASNSDIGMDSTYYYAYSAENGKMTIKGVTDEDKNKATLEYKLKDGILTIVDKNNKTIFSESTLGSAQYYKDGEKKPEGITTTPTTTVPTKEAATQSTAKSTTQATTKAK